MKLKFLLLPLLTMLITTSNCFNFNPSKSDLILTLDSEPKSRQIRNAKEDGDYDEFNHEVEIPKIYSLRIKSKVSNRYAETVIISKVRNEAKIAQETVFAVILPEKAFISKFVMAVNGRDHTSHVKEKEEAEGIYNKAVEKGQTAAHVVASVRDSNRFTVFLNIEPLSKATFYLTYEQLLELKDNMYELIININPRQPVKDLEVEVEINESVPLRMVRAPPIRSGNNLIQSQQDLDPRAKIQRINRNSARINFKPDIHRQKELAKFMNHFEETGLSGQFVVQYDVERNQNGGEVLLEDGFFIHFFAPPKQKPLSKNVLFVLDTSGSMEGAKIEQLKTAMKKILNDLKSDDKFSLIEFNFFVIHLHLDGSRTTYTGGDLNQLTLRPSDYVTSENRDEAERVVANFAAGGGTNIYDSLMFALHSVNELKGNPNEPQPIIIFLTDGDATVGNTNHNEIIEDVTKNNKYKTPIYCLSFGADAKKDLLKKLSLRNYGFSRHIYEGADAAIQLHDFYKMISLPIMNNITFKYVSDAKEVTKTTFPIMYNGSELVVTGKLDKNNFDTLPTITAQSATGPINLVPEVKKPVTKLERLWAYVTIQQLLEEKEISENSENEEEIKQKALDIALKYNFVTPVSSMVVVKPNATNDVVDLIATGKDEPIVSLDMSTTTITPTTTTTTTTTTQRPKEKIVNVDQLKRKVPWIDEILKDDLMKTEKGTYKIDINKRSPDDVTCPTTPMGGTGYCKFIHDCPEMLRFLTNMHIFEQYQCDIEGYAAICCPPTRPIIQ
ncbi:inter-alpha-trypsin inhibitor heavy chain H4-like [Onthophagus taurus]|uniref:inter-alpha-trypsin inhibitor heavy chain H4-like n=1 Tax=Onthophagus taurus TaxID=166361 RepID=UPI0039BDA6EB